MVFPPPEERELSDRGEPLPGEQPEAAGVPEQAEPQTDQKILDLESQLEGLRKLKAGEQAERLRDLESENAELAARRQEREKYAELDSRPETGGAAAGAAAEVGPGTEAARAAAAHQITAAKLLGDDPQAAVASLVTLATSSTSGFEKAVQLVRSVAVQPGGAWILDEFHKRMTSSSKGGAQGARG